MSSTILSHFPLSSPRRRQEKVLLEIESALKSGYRYIFLEAPTGFGKTPVAIAMARYLGSSHICTATKDLQAQYRRDFPFVVEVKGRGNFPCIVKEDMGLDESCDYGPCVKDDSYDCIYKTRLMDYKVRGEGTKSELVQLDPFAEGKYVENLKRSSKIVDLDWRPCHYFHQKWIGLRSSYTVYNYRYFLSDVFYAGTAQRRSLLVLDEAHLLESEVGDFRSFSVNRHSLRFLRMQMPEKNVDEVETWIEFCKTLRERLVDFVEKAEGIIERSNQKFGLEPYTERNLIDAREREQTLDAVIDDIKSNKNNWIVSNIMRDESGQLVKATLMPLDVSGYFDAILDKGSVALFMSATILSKDHLCKTSGLEPDKVKFIRIEESDFPVDNRPIYLKNVAWLNAKTMIESMPRIVTAINDILNDHKNEKGIIHTTSYSQLQFIKDNIGKEHASRLIETGAKLDRTEVLETHYQSKKPTVLISPSLHLGVDLKDDLSRFQIIVKVPYPDLTDKRVLEKKKLDPNWYTWNTVLRLVQSYGRSVRSVDDHATTFILDSSISYLLKIAADLVPKWFREAIKP
ncbi:MAG TPA: ATP-dependent DNA helicase [Nitrososphaera sp.]|jgi:Rad3-related DNA helicase|nr:ATP-dependent DNA helicase [Nitrososphaera sp.]